MRLEPRAFSQEELQTCSEIFPKFSNLIHDERFAHAASIAANNFNEPRLSIRMAALWSGIEALLGFEQELRFRISFAVASLLESEHSKRQERFSAVKRLYDLRSKSVHGATSDPHESPHF
jgi:hypothetical protein